MTTVFVRGLEFYGFHGVPDEEQVVGHRYRINLALDVRESARDSDAVGDTIDYAAAAQLALKVAQSGRYRTIERVANLVGQALLAEYAEVMRVKVRIEKPLPPADLIAEAVGVEMTLLRDLA